MIPRSCSFKILQIIEFREEFWLPWQQNEKNFKNLFVPNRKAQNTSNCGSGMEISPMLWGLGFHIEIKKEIFENLLVPNCNG